MGADHRFGFFLVSIMMNAYLNGCIYSTTHEKCIRVGTILITLTGLRRSFTRYIVAPEIFPEVIVKCFTTADGLDKRMPIIIARRMQAYAFERPERTNCRQCVFAQ